MKLYLRDPRNNNFNLDIDQEQITVTDLKNRIAAHIDVEADNQILVHLGSVFQDGDVVELASATEKNVIQVFYSNVRKRRASNASLSVVRRIIVRDFTTPSRDGGLDSTTSVASSNPVPENQPIRIRTQVDAPNGNREVHGFMIKAKELVYDLKQLIENRLQINYRDQVLSYGDRVLENGRKLRYYDITRNNVTVILETKDEVVRDQEGFIQIFIRTLTGASINLHVKPTDTVETLKNEICYCQGVAPEEQRLIYIGKQLEDGKTLKDYGIEKDATIHMVLRLRGGSAPVDCHLHQDLCSCSTIQ